DFVDRDDDPDERGMNGPAAGHGTFIAGLVALAAPRARVMPLRVLDPNGEGNVFDAAEAIAYATRHGASVVCMSFGTRPGRSALALATAVAAAHAAGVVLVAAAGNDGSDELPYPASDTANVLAVGAANGDRPARFSNHGPGVGVWAPGVDLVSAMP